jgi:hypothetical protein
MFFASTLSAVPKLFTDGDVNGFVALGVYLAISWFKFRLKVHFD